VPVDGATVPNALRHRVTVVPGASDTTAAQSVEGARVTVSADVAVIGPPLRGTGWLAANGPDAVSGHRRALVPVDGTPAIAQRFAIDWLKIDDSTRSFTGDAAKNETHYAEGNEALAVADGVVAVTHDGIP